MKRNICLLSIIVLTLVCLSAILPAQSRPAYKVLHSFTAAVDGGNPILGTWDAAGNLYGVTSYGGSSADCFGGGCGTIFKLVPNPDGTWTYSVIHIFVDSADGVQPTGPLILDGAGNLYGTAQYGGLGGCAGQYGTGCGVVFKLAPNTDGTWTYSLLHRFTGADGDEPRGGLIFDATGNPYGAATCGGLGGSTSYGEPCGGSGNGTVFKLAPNPDGTWTESVLYRFTGADGEQPQSQVTFDAAGNLYGTTLFGGAYGPGVVFKLSPNPDGTWAESVLHSFNGTDGAYSYSALISDAAGNFYGTATMGGASYYGYGTVFKLARNPDGTWAYSQLYNFTGADGNYPNWPVIFDKAGDLYGTTGCCGPDYDGKVFKLTPNPDGTWTETVLHGFWRDGIWPGPVILDKAGNLYGTAGARGPKGGGALWEITLSTGGPPVVSLTPASVPFLQLRTVGSTSLTQTVKLTNVGSAGLNITGITVTGLDPGDFAQSNNCPPSVASGGSCLITVTFTPTAQGLRTASVSITDNAPGSPQTVPLTGRGTFFEWSPRSLNMGDQPVSTSSVARTVTLTNAGSAPITLYSIEIGGVNPGDFTQTHTCGSSLNAAASCTIQVTFAPTAAGARLGHVAIRDSAFGGTHLVGLFGKGT
jgi:uncharacterized repeat protein (TIGR03803 family)